MPSTKAELRRGALTRRDAIGAPERATFAARLASIGPRLVLEAAPPGAPQLVASLFSPIRSEPDTRLLAEALHASGVPMVLPVAMGNSVPLTFRRWVPGDRLAAGPLGIAEPLKSAPETDPDVLFVPLAAFDRRGYRIGYGAGNYDRTLAALRARKPVRTIGIGYAVQEELFIPSEPHDEPVDFIVTERDILICTA